jgi:16S rRNA (cytidine1402-2'-O)-methyltransferase
MAGKLYLIPSTIGETPVEEVIPPSVQIIIRSIRIYIVENERTARRMLIKFGINTPIDQLKFFILNKYTSQSEIPDFFSSIATENIGLLSEAGVPAIADPGSEVIRLAHSRNIEVIPLVGPSSILMAMMASGLNGQNFAFTGYLPVKANERIRRIKHLEQRSQLENQSQIFIEAPYRNNQLLKDLLTACHPQTELCIASNITGEGEYIRTATVRTWKKNIPDLNKKPTIFILHKLK